MGTLVAMLLFAVLLIGATTLVFYGSRPNALTSKTDSAAIEGPAKHKHQWRYHSSHFNPPTGQEVTGNGDPVVELAAKLAYGFTNVTYTCAIDECTEVRIETIVGRVSDPFQGREYKG